MDLRWAIDEALDGLRGEALEAVGVPRKSWPDFCTSTGQLADQPAIDYRGVRFEPTAGADLAVRLKARADPVPAVPRLPLQAFAWPPRPVDRPLYYRATGRVAHEREALSLAPGAAVSFDSFFNSFFERYWAQHTSVRAVSLLLEGSGPLTCAVWRTSPGGARRRIMRVDLSLEEARPVALPLALAEADDPGSGRLHLEVEAHAVGARLERVTWAAVQPPLRTPAVGVCICTFDRERQLERLLRDVLGAPGAAAVAAVTVVNQGAPLVSPALAALQESDARLKVIDQANHGGAGGFTRAAMDLLDREGVSHILFADDDVELEPASLATAAAFLSYATDPVVVGGHMLDLYQRTRLFDGGGRVAGGTIEANNRLLDLADPRSLDALTTVAPCDFNGWWLAVAPVEAFKAHGLPLPLFIHVDDVEFGVRLTEAGIATVAPPAVAVWHEPYTAKPPSWFSYYDVRNWLIFATLYPHRHPLQRPLTLLKQAVSLTIRHDYHQAASLALGLRDFVRGPRVLGEPAPALHARIRRTLDRLRAETLPPNGGGAPATEDAPAGRLPRRVRLLSNLARALLARPRKNPAGTDCVLGPMAPLDLMSLGRSYVQKDTDGVFALRFGHDRVQAWRSLASLGWAIALYALGSRRAARRWRAVRRELSDPAAWRTRLGLGEGHAAG